MRINPVKLFNDAKDSLPEEADIVVIGSGLGALSAAALLVKEGLRIVILEKNYIPGGCTSSYERQGYVFESGATTLVGLDDEMPLAVLLKETGIRFESRTLPVPMKVILKTGKTVTRYSEIGDWITEAERVFGKKGMKSFWEECYSISRKIWAVSSRQLYFPPDSPKDYLKLIQSFRLNDLGLLPYMFKSIYDLLKKHNLHNHKEFIDFVDEQLMITAQNKHSQVNALFGATALCYTNFGNYYVDGGLVRMIAAFTDYIKSNGGKLRLKNSAEKIERTAKGFKVITSEGAISCSKILSGIPLNNLKAVYSFKSKKLPFREMEAGELNSAFQAGVVFKSKRTFETLHYQIHHKKAFSLIGSGSLFVSLSHPEDKLRAEEGIAIASVSTHVSQPDKWKGEKTEILKEVVAILIDEGFFNQEDLIYMHCSDPQDWQKWTGRYFGFVGGYPQKLDIKPWQMNSARLEKGLYTCGDSVYPGQGIPGVVLSGMIAASKIKADLN